LVVLFWTVSVYYALEGILTSKFVEIESFFNGIEFSDIYDGSKSFCDPISL